MKITLEAPVIPAIGHSVRYLHRKSGRYIFGLAQEKYSGLQPVQCDDPSLALVDDGMVARTLGLGAFGKGVHQSFSSEDGIRGSAWTDWEALFEIVETDLPKTGDAFLKKSVTRKGGRFDYIRCDGSKVESRTNF